MKRKWLVLGVGSTVGENEYGSYFAAGTPMKQFVRHRLEPTLLPFEEKILGEKVCPFCAETIKAEAIKCKHCGSDLGE